MTCLNTLPLELGKGKWEERYRLNIRQWQARPSISWVISLVSSYSSIKHNLMVCLLLLFIIITEEDRTLRMVCQGSLLSAKLVFTMNKIYNELYLKFHIFHIVLYFPTCLFSIWMNHKSHYSRFINISKLNKVFDENL